MRLSAAIFQALSSNSALTALVADRIYPLKGPDNAPAPHLIFQFISGSDTATSHGEASGATIRLVQFACFARTYEAAQELREKVVTALDNIRLANGDIGDLEDDSREDYDDAAKLYRCDCDISF